MSARREPAERIIDAMLAVPVSLAEASRQLIRIGRQRRCVTRPPSPPAAAQPVAPESVRPEQIVVASADAVIIGNVSDLPIEGYDHLSARQILDRLGALSEQELMAVADHERQHRRRQTVLQRIAQLS